MASAMNNPDAPSKLRFRAGALMTAAELAVAENTLPPRITESIQMASESLAWHMGRDNEHHMLHEIELLEQYLALIRRKAQG